VNGAFALDNRTIRVVLGFAGVLFDHPDTFDQDLGFGWKDLENLPGRAPVVARDDFDGIAAAHVEFGFAHK
jgi:hypothetical protein